MSFPRSSVHRHAGAMLLYDISALMAAQIINMSHFSHSNGPSGPPLAQSCGARSSSTSRQRPQRIFSPLSTVRFRDINCRVDTSSPSSSAHTSRLAADQRPSQARPPPANTYARCPPLAVLPAGNRQRIVSTSFSLRWRSLATRRSRTGSRVQKTTCARPNRKAYLHLRKVHTISALAHRRRPWAPLTYGRIL